MKHSLYFSFFFFCIFLSGCYKDFWKDYEIICDVTLPPGGLVADSISSNSVILKWNAIAGAQFVIQYKLSSDQNWVEINTASYRNRFVLEKLGSVQIYEFKVKSVCPNNGEASVFSDVSSFITLPEMQKIEGGVFTMGQNDPDIGGSGNSADEAPIHSVTVSGFYISKYEVTQNQWFAIMGTNPSFFQNCGNCPIEGISWNDIQIFLQKLDSVSGINYRLPTEAEWEYSASGGVSTHDYQYSGSNTLSEVAWYNLNSGSATKSIGQKTSNELMLYDLTGNVAEWCSDGYAAYTANQQTDPQGSPNASEKVIRGGSWSSDSNNARLKKRSHLPSGFYQSAAVGFRLVRSQ